MLFGAVAFGSYLYNIKIAINPSARSLFSTHIPLYSPKGCREEKQ